MNKDLYTVDYNSSANLTPLEAQILVQYQQLATTLKQLNTEIETTINQPTAGLIENLRVLEMKMGLVFTLFKGAVYSLFLQQENLNNIDEEQEFESTSDLQY